MLLHGFTDPQTTVDVDCACVAEMVYCTLFYRLHRYFEIVLTVGQASNTRHSVVCDFQRIDFGAFCAYRWTQAKLRLWLSLVRNTGLWLTCFVLVERLHSLRPYLPRFNMLGRNSH